MEHDSVVTRSWGCCRSSELLFRELKRSDRVQLEQTQAPNPRPAAVSGKAEPAPGEKKKLSYKEQPDWDALETRILEAEEKLASFEAEAARPEVASNAARVLELHTAAEQARAEIDALYARWAELEPLQQP